MARNCGYDKNKLKYLESWPQIVLHDDMKIFVKKVEGVALPEKGSQVAAGYDVVATSDPKIVGDLGAGTTEWKRIDYIEYETNLFIAPSAVSFHTLIHPRSSVSKYNLVLANSIGLVDNDYRGMVICRFKYIYQPIDIKVYGTSDGSPWRLFTVIDTDKIYKKGDKIAQLVVEPTVSVEWEFADDLSQTQRGTGGFGSTDKTGKAITEVFEEEKKKFEAKKPQSVSPILDKFKEVVHNDSPLPYSERMKERMKP